MGVAIIVLMITIHLLKLKEVSISIFSFYFEAIGVSKFYPIFFHLKDLLEVK
jgi:hypothetical protein